MSQFGVDATHPLFDATQMDLEALAANDDPNLAACIDAILGTLNDPDGIISAFQSFASD